MYVYLFVLIILLRGAFHFETICDNKSRRWYILEWLLLVLVAGLRYKIGGDTASYMGDYDRCPTISELQYFDFTSAHFQPLWYVFCALCKVFGSEFVYMQIIHSLIVNSTFLWFFKKYCKKPFFCVLIYAVFFYMNYNTEVLRAALSVCVFLFSYKFLVHKEWIKYAVFIVIAYGFHAQSIVLVLFPLCHVISKMRFSRIVIITTLLSITLYMFDYIPIFGNMLQSLDAIASYMEQYSSSYASLNIFGIIMQIIPVFLWIIILYFTKDIHDERKFFIVFFIACTVGSLKFHVIFGRNLVFAYPFLITYLVSYYRKCMPYAVLYFCVFWSWLNFYTWQEAPNFKTYRKYYPYSSWIDKTEDQERNRVAGRGIW